MVGWCAAFWKEQLLFRRGQSRLFMPLNQILISKLHFELIWVLIYYLISKCIGWSATFMPICKKKLAREQIHFHCTACHPVKTLAASRNSFLFILTTKIILIQYNFLPWWTSPHLEWPVLNLNSTWIENQDHRSHLNKWNDREWNLKVAMMLL